MAHACTQLRTNLAVVGVSYRDAKRPLIDRLASQAIRNYLPTDKPGDEIDVQFLVIVLPSRNVPSRNVDEVQPMISLLFLCVAGTDNHVEVVNV
jgi:hypothetical protein